MLDRVLAVVGGILGGAAMAYFLMRRMFRFAFSACVARM
jgi:hypothetical protein